MMNILVTGGLGFIGHEVVTLLQQDHNVVVVDNLTNYGFIPSLELDYLFQERKSQLKCTVKVGDIRDQDYIKSIIQVNKIDCVIHLASFPRQKVVQQNPSVASEVMSTGLINLLEASKGYVSKFVYISSSMVYGDFDDMVKETHPCNPRGQYAIMKYMGEKLVEDYRKHFDYTIIRPSAVYGPRDVEDRVVSKFMTMAMRGETLKVRGANEVLDFTYVEDTAIGIILTATKDVANGNIYNITRSSEKQYTLKDAAELAISIAGKGNFEIEARDLSFPKRGRLDITRAINDLGYSPKVNVEEGFRRYYEWYKEKPILWDKNK